MVKEFKFYMGKQIIEMAQKCLRKREEIILLLLNTIRMLEINSNFSKNKETKVIISINKMNRIFYILKNKFFSFQFPFFIDYKENQIRIYHKTTGIDMKPMVLSFLIEAFEKMNQTEIDFDVIFDLIMESEATRNKCLTIREMWILISHLLKFDFGYIRYDYDPEKDNGKQHPLHHLDIAFDSSTTFKIGLNNKIEYCDFEDILDTTTDCWYLAKK